MSLNQTYVVNLFLGDKPLGIEGMGLQLASVIHDHC